MTDDDKRGNDPLQVSGRVLLDRYLVETAIARGGMAAIYRGHDQRLLRPVCIKMFHSVESDNAFRTAYQHFVQEAFALSQLAHPNTLRVYDFGHIEDRGAMPFQVSELLEGGTLGEYLRQRGAIGGEEALEILDPITGSLAEAHEHGIIHRDIKPSNILFALAGGRRLVKVCDFGIAKVESSSRSPRRAEETVGGDGSPLRLMSPGWCAPEQLRGRAIGPQVDVFSVGLLAAAILTGGYVFPISHEARAIELRMRSDAHIDEFLAKRQLSQSLKDVIRRATRERIEERTPSIEQFAVELRAAVRAHDVQPVTSAEPVPTRITRDRTPVRVDLAESGSVEAGGRRVELVGVDHTERVDLGADTDWPVSPARFRITFNGATADGCGVSVRGLNCFVVEAGKNRRVTTAIDVEHDMSVELLTADRRVLEVINLVFGRPNDGMIVYDLEHVSLWTRPSVAVLLDVGPGSHMALLHRITDTK